MIAILSAGVAAVADEAAYCLQPRPDAEPELLQTVFPGLDAGTATDRAGWIWTGASRTGDQWQSGLLLNPVSGAVSVMPALYRRPCASSTSVARACRVALSQFSETLGVAYLGGHRANAAGQPAPGAFVLFGDRILELPSDDGATTRYLGDLPGFGMMVFAMPDARPLVYDGSRFTALDAGTGTEPLRPWRLINDPAGGRAFIASTEGGAPGRGPSFLLEIREGPRLSPVTLDPRIEGAFTLASLDDGQAWIIARSGIYAEKASGFERVAHLTGGRLIRDRQDLGATVGGEIALAITDAGGRIDRHAITRDVDGCAVPLSLGGDRPLP
ncbi:MAG: hypothetical protein AAF577_02710 [Pseudomonadota bacterium]